MIWALRILLVLVWMPSQYLGWLLGAIGALGWQTGERSATLIGVVAFITPAALMIGGLFLSWRDPELGVKVLVIPIAVLMVEVGLMLLFAAMAGRK